LYNDFETRSSWQPVLQSVVKADGVCSVFCMALIVISSMGFCGDVEECNNIFQAEILPCIVVFTKKKKFREVLGRRGFPLWQLYGCSLCICTSRL